MHKALTARFSTRDLVESNFERTRLSLLSIIQKQREMKNNLTMVKTAEEKEMRSLEDMLKDIRVRIQLRYSIHLVL